MFHSVCLFCAALYHRPLANKEALANPEALEEFKDRTELLG